MGFGHKSPTGKDVGVYKTKPWQSLRDKTSWFSHETEDNFFSFWLISRGVVKKVSTT